MTEDDENRDLFGEKLPEDADLAGGHVPPPKQPPSDEEPAAPTSDDEPIEPPSDEEPIEPPTEEMFALEVRLRESDDVPALDPAVRAALLESSELDDSAAARQAEKRIAAPAEAGGTGAPAEAGTPGEDPAESEAAGAGPGEADASGEPPDESADGPESPTGEHQPESTEEWELPAGSEITAEHTAELTAAARNEVHEAVEFARRTGRPWDPSRPPVVGDFEPPGRRPRYWWRFLLATLVIVISFAGATSASVINIFNDIASDLTPTAGKKYPDWITVDSNGGPQTIAIIGSDARTGGGMPDDDPGRSDTTILLRLDPDTGQIAMLSIPRDLKVDIPGYGTDKFNAAYSYGGMPLTIKTIKEVTGLDVNHVINVDFQGFAMLVDAIGCVFIDVDRKYYNSNEGKAPSDMYAEIDIEAGYQKLCGPDALEYARYRHTDSDLARASRQQGLLGEVRNRLSFSEIIKRRSELVQAFTVNSTSDISNSDQILELIKLLFDSRDARVAEVKFPATFSDGPGASYVLATGPEIARAVDQFLGFEESRGPVGTLDEGENPASRIRRKQARKLRERAKKRRVTPAGSTMKVPGKDEDELVDASQGGIDLAAQLYAGFKIHDLPVMYPKRLPEGAIYAEGSRSYHLRDLDKNPHKAYRIVIAIQRDDGLHYFGLQGIHGWQDPPVLAAPHDTVKAGSREFRVYTAGDRIRYVAWFERGNTYWVSNSILLTLTNEQMLGMARSTRAFSPAP